MATKNELKAYEGMMKTRRELSFRLKEYTDTIDNIGEDKDLSEKLKKVTVIIDRVNSEIAALNVVMVNENEIDMITPIV